MQPNQMRICFWKMQLLRENSRAKICARATHSIFLLCYHLQYLSFQSGRRWNNKRRIVFTFKRSVSLFTACKLYVYVKREKYFVIISVCVLYGRHHLMAMGFAVVVII